MGSASSIETTTYDPAKFQQSKAVMDSGADDAEKFTKLKQIWADEKAAEAAAAVAKAAVSALVAASNDAVANEHKASADGASADSNSDSEQHATTPVAGAADPAPAAADSHAAPNKTSVPALTDSTGDAKPSAHLEELADASAKKHEHAAGAKTDEHKTDALAGDAKDNSAPINATAAPKVATPDAHTDNGTKPVTNNTPVEQTNSETAKHDVAAAATAATHQPTASDSH